MDATQICGLLDADLVTFIHNIVVLLKIAVPVILVIIGMLDFAKGVIANKEDEIKKGQQTFIKRLIAAVCVFFVVTIVQLVMGFISKDDNSFWSCADQILNGTAGTKYEPTGIKGTENNGINNTNNNSNNNSSNNVENGADNNQKEQLPITQQQVDESYQGDGLTNNNNVNSNQGTTTHTTTKDPNANKSDNSSAHQSENGHSHSGNGGGNF